MSSVGEVDCLVTLESIQLRLRALIMEDLQAHCFGGTTFHADNSIQTNIKERTINIHGKFVVEQDNNIHNIPLFPPPRETTSVERALSRKTSSTPIVNNLCPNVEPAEPVKFNAVSVPSENVVFPGE